VRVWDIKTNVMPDYHAGIAAKRSEAKQTPLDYASDRD
jgi:hypothetical protein